MNLQDLTPHRRPWGSLATLALAAAALCACGGGSGESSSPTPTPPPVATPTQQGLFIDAPVAGLGYTTSGGYSGVTDASGAFKYNAGDTVSFKLGSLVLGTAPGGASLYPADLARKDPANQARIATNLMVLLQSLNTTPGSAVITLPSSLQSAALPALDLTLDPASFASGGNAALSQVLTLGGGKLVTPAAALASASHHLMSITKGVWQVHGNDGKAIPAFWRFDGLGGYAMVDASQALASANGIEIGQLSLDPVTLQYASTARTLDTNGSSGLSHRDAASLAQTLRQAGAHLSVHAADGSRLFELRRVATSSGLVGVWTFEPASDLSASMLIYLPGDQFVLFDSAGANDVGCKAPPGVEIGVHSYNAATGKVLIGSKSVDTNGCAGFDTGHSYTVVLSADGQTLTATWPEGTMDKLVRVQP